MAVTDQQTVYNYTASGSASAFSFDCRILDEDDVVVQLDGVTLERDVDYTVSGVGDVGGVVTFAVAPVGALRIFRAVQPIRITDYQYAGDFLADVVNADFDRLVMMIQDMRSGGVAQANTVRAPPGEVLPELLDAASRAGTLLGFDSDGDPVPNIPASGSAAAVVLDLADSVTLTKGAGMVAYSSSVSYPAGSVGAQLNNSVIGEAYNILRDIPPAQWAAVLNGTSAVDHSTILQARINTMAASVGGTIFFPGLLLCNTPIILKSGVSFLGLGRATSGIRKDSSTTLAVTITATGLIVVYNNTALPSAINCIVALDGTAGRFIGRIENMSLTGTLATPGNYETPKVEFGIVSLGSVSDTLIRGNQVTNVQYGALFPSIFACEGIAGNRFEGCLQGLLIESGTSCPITANYANNCRDYGFLIRDHKYSEVSSNAVDYLNDPTKYPTRTRLCSAFKFQACLGLTVTNNGDENTWGRSYEFDAFDHSTFEGNMSIAIGSDYTGASHIAWIYSTDIMRGSSIRNNFAYSVKPGGLTYAGANAAFHHNIYFEGQGTVQQIKFDNNVVRALRTGSVAEAGWLNNVPATWLNAASGDALIYTHSPIVEAQTPGNLSLVYGSENRHYIEQRGKLRHVWGCFHFTPTYTTASGLLIVNNFPVNGSDDAALSVIGVGGGSGLAVKLGWFEMSGASTSGLGRTDGDANFLITDIPTTTAVKIYYDGWYST